VLRVNEGGLSMIVTLKTISAAKEFVKRQTCARPKLCISEPARPLSAIMESEWEELVITLDRSKNKYEFKTACCPGAQAC
jgi:hypothetical protein